MAHAGEGAIAVGVDLNITHHRAVRHGTVTAVATALHLGRTVATYAIAMTDDSATSSRRRRLTCVVKTRT